MERLRSFTRPPPKKEEDLRNEHLKKLSEDRVKNWPNTLGPTQEKGAVEGDPRRRGRSLQGQSRQRGTRIARSGGGEAYAKAKYLKFENQDKTK